MVSHVVHFLSDMEGGSQFCEMSLLANIHTPASEDVQSYPMLASYSNKQRNMHHGVCSNHSSVQSHDTWLTRKFKISVWVESELEAWEVRWARSVLSHELEHSRNQTHECKKIPILTLAIAIADIMTGFTWQTKYLGNKLLYDHVPDSFPWCGIGSGHTRLGWYRVYAHHMHPKI